MTIYLIKCDNFITPPHINELSFVIPANKAFFYDVCYKYQLLSQILNSCMLDLIPLKFVSYDTREIL